MKDMRKYRKVANNQRWLEGLWRELGCIFYQGTIIRGKRLNNSCTIMETSQMFILVPVLRLNQMSDEKWNKLAKRMNER